MPTPRSGHSFTHVGGVNYLLYGGIDNSKKVGGKIMPNNDVYAMKIGSSKYPAPVSLLFLNSWRLTFD